MSSTPLIRLAVADSVADAAGVQSIYAPIVRETAISFEVEPPSVEEMQQRIAATLPRYPWLICEHEGQIKGYVYAAPHSTRAAYAWSVNVSVYIHAHCRRAGVGRALYLSLFEILRLQGFYNAFAGATLPNPASIGLHESLGFVPVGTYHSVGYKFNTWHSTAWWQLTLQEHSPTPSPTLSLDQLQEHPNWQAALDMGVPFLRL